MSKHHTSHPSNQRPAPRQKGGHPGKVAEDLDTLDLATDVLSFDAHEHTEIQKDLGAIASFRQAQKPVASSSTFESNEHTEVNVDIDVNAARELARRRFAGEPKLNPVPTPVHTAPGPVPAMSDHATPFEQTFDANEKTEFGLDPANLMGAPGKPRTRFATTAQKSVAAKPVQAQRAGHHTGAHPAASPRATGGHPVAAPQPRHSGAHAQIQRQHPSSTRASTAVPQSQAPQNQTPQRQSPQAQVSQPPLATGAFQQVQRPVQQSGAYPAMNAPHTSGAYPSVPAAAPYTGEIYQVAAPHESTQPSREALVHPVSPVVMDPAVESSAPAPLGYLDLGLKSPLVTPNMRRQVEFLKEETGVDFDPMAMSSPNLNALVLAMGAQQLDLQSTAAALILDDQGEIIPLHLKWGDVSTAPSPKMRLHYGLWGGFVGAVLGLAAVVLISLVTQNPISSLGVFGVFLLLFPCVLSTTACAAQPRRIETLLFKTRLLPAPSTPSVPS